MRSDHLDHILITLLEEGDYDFVLDLIVDSADAITRDEVTEIMEAVRTLDPTLSGIGAEVRDALRDNTVHSVD